CGMSDGASPLRLAGVCRTYRSGDADLHVLRGADLTLEAGEIVALVAASGTGKSTLLHLAGLLERPDDGAVLVDGRDSGRLPDSPGVRLASGPTGNLDVGTSGIVFEELLRMVRAEGVAALIATHNPDLAARMDRRVTLHEGRVVPA